VTNKYLKGTGLKVAFFHSAKAAAPLLECYPCPSASRDAAQLCAGERPVPRMTVMHSIIKLNSQTKLNSSIMVNQQLRNEKIIQQRVEYHLKALSFSCKRND
jgi:hypothetical protein